MASLHHCPSWPCPYCTPEMYEPALKNMPPIYRGKIEDQPRTYTTKSGRVLTEEDIEKLVEEAERGYDLSDIKERTKCTCHQGRECLNCMKKRGVI